MGRIKYTQKELDKILADHKLWLSDNSKGRYADLRNADLRNADLRNADLSYAALTNAILSYADLTNAVLSYADLSYAYLTNANLSNANLSNANLSYAVLSYAVLSYAVLRNANLSYAYLANADLTNTNLTNADLRFLVGNLRKIRNLLFDKYHITYTQDIVAIGCVQKDYNYFNNLTPEEADKLDNGDGDWWKKNKATIMNIINNTEWV